MPRQYFYAGRSALTQLQGSATEMGHHLVPVPMTSIDDTLTFICLDCDAYIQVHRRNPRTAAVGDYETVVSEHIFRDCPERATPPSRERPLGT